MSRRFFGLKWGVVAHGVLVWAGGLGGRADAAAPDFRREVRPILEQSCFPCHGPEKQKSDYRLDIRAIALRGGKSGRAAMVPHQAKASPLIQRVSGDDPERLMPPQDSEVRPLSAEQVSLLQRWIDSGPVWPDELAGPAELKPPAHWSWRPLTKPAVPNAAGNPIDAFIQAKWTELRLTGSPSATPRTLLRRLSFDLTGLPPTPEEVAAFAHDSDPQAYGKQVTRLLNSPQYGERWARHWLDTIHFADSHGYEHDIGREHAWRFRDYVIEAFNRDTRWPRFIREQIAADVFYPAEPRLTAALGFLGAGTFDLSTYSTGPVTFDYLDRDDLVAQTTSAFISTTANCARCHEHKFDPVTQEDYYALQAVFAGVLKGDVRYDEDPQIAKDRRHWESLAQAAERRDPAMLLAPETQTLVNDWIAQRGPGARWEPLHVETYLATDGSILTRQTEGTISSGGPRPEKDTYVVTGTVNLAQVTALRLEVLADEALPQKGPGRNDNGNFHLSELELRVFADQRTNSKTVQLRRATADFNQTDWGIERALDGDPKTAWGIHPAVGQAHQAVFELGEPLGIQVGGRVAVVLKQAHGGGHLIGRFRLSVTGDEAARAAVPPGDVDAALAVPSSARSESQRVAVAAYVLRTIAQAAQAKLPPPSVVYAAASQVGLVDKAGPGSPKSLAAPKVVHVLQRGDFGSPRAVVAPGALSSLQHLPARFSLANPQDEGSRRAALADWIAHPDNFLTWRSVVNRVWHYHFGRGLCDTPSDLGKMGGIPSHPELIDWLAGWFRDDAQGSLKELHRLIVTSATYQQSSAHRTEMAQIDNDNRLLWRQNCHRLDADSVRDAMLAVSGALNLQLGGPAIMHFKQGPGPQLTPSLDYTGYDWAKPEASRRSIYRCVWRGIADPFMEALDFPDLGLLSPVRGFSVSSLQALTLFNNDFVLYQSQRLAKRLESEATSLKGQVQRAVQLVWLREPRVAELQYLTDYATRAGSPALARVLLNSNEFLFIE